MRPVLSLSIISRPRPRFAPRRCAAALSVIRAGLDRESTWIVGTYRQHDPCAAAAHGMSCQRRRKPLSAFSPYASPWSADALWLTARPFARKVTYRPINIMTDSTSTMYRLSTLAAGRLAAAVTGHTAARSATFLVKVKNPVLFPLGTSHRTIDGPSVVHVSP